jgi:hypothetical protein
VNPRIASGDAIAIRKGLHAFSSVARFSQKTYIAEATKYGTHVTMNDPVVRTTTIIALDFFGVRWFLLCTLHSLLFWPPLKIRILLGSLSSFGTWCTEASWSDFCSCTTLRRAWYRITIYRTVIIMIGRNPNIPVRRTRPCGASRINQQYFPPLVHPFHPIAGINPMIKPTIHVQSISHRARRVFSHS